MVRFSRRAFLWLATLFVPATRSLAAQATSLEDFLDLSQRLTGRKNLDRELAQIYLSALNADPVTAPTLAYLIQVNNNPMPEMRALAATIVEWWYTGVYTAGGKPQVATHVGALAWSGLDMPAPGTCAGAFGAWANPPR